MSVDYVLAHNVPEFVHSLAGVPWRVSSELEPGEAYFSDGVLYADSVDTVRKLVDELNRKNGV